MQFIDAHTHIHFPAYDVDREDVFRRAKEANVKMITVGTQFSTSVGAVEYAKKHAGDVWATVGFHPAHFSANWYHDKNEQLRPEREAFEITQLRQIAQLPEVVAIGECGLDFFRDKSEETKNNQKRGFLEHVEIAHEVKKPLMIHCRSAFGDLIDMLHDSRSTLHDLPGVIHFFSGTKDEAKKLLDLGFAFTFGGVVTFTHDYDEVIKMLPLEAILSETDAPYVLPEPYRSMARERGRENGSFPVAEILKPLGFKEERSDDAPYVAPVPYRGKRNEPAYVVDVMKKLAELKSISAEEAAWRIFENAKRIFNI